MKRVVITNVVCIIAVTRLELTLNAYWTTKELITLEMLKQPPTTDVVKDLTDVGKNSELMTKVNHPITAKWLLATICIINITVEGMQK
jgi:hypothetical protein